MGDVIRFPISPVFSGSQIVTECSFGKIDPPIEIRPGDVRYTYSEFAKVHVSGTKPKEPVDG